MSGLRVYKVLKGPPIPWVDAAGESQTGRWPRVTITSAADDLCFNEAVDALGQRRRVTTVHAVPWHGAAVEPPTSEEAPEVLAEAEEDLAELLASRLTRKQLLAIGKAVEIPSITKWWNKATMAEEIVAAIGPQGRAHPMVRDALGEGLD